MIYWISSKILFNYFLLILNKLTYYAIFWMTNFSIFMQKAYNFHL